MSPGSRDQPTTLLWHGDQTRWEIVDVRRQTSPYLFLESTTSQEEESPDTIEEEREGKEADLKEGKDYYPDKREENKDAAKEKKEKKENVVKKEERKESTPEEKDIPKEREGKESGSKEAEEKKEISAEAGEGSEEVAVEGREGKEADGELIEAEESREVVTGQSRGDTAEDRLFIDLGSLIKRPPRPPQVHLSSKPHSSGPGKSQVPCVCLSVSCCRHSVRRVPADQPEQWPRVCRGQLRLPGVWPSL